MDPITLAIAAAVATGVATGAGETAGAALATLTGRIRDRFTDRREELESTETAATALDEEFARDPEFQRECLDLWRQAGGDTTNSFTGQARNVIQARDVHGGITLN
ncbi:hypothetical protein [Actinocorallia libanotica]|uniref:Uncharacterized protein n=1 Tax=Actinocorallia libanotica TaxID=46162 RepID=A0ABN1RMM9_9ACTN